MLTEFIFVQFQYFLWYLSLLPLILHRVQIKMTKALKMLLAWLTSQVNFWASSRVGAMFKYLELGPLPVLGIVHVVSVLSLPETIIRRFERKPLGEKFGNNSMFCIKS